MPFDTMTIWQNWSARPVLKHEKAIAARARKWYTFCREEPSRKREAPPVARREGGVVKTLLLVVGAFFASAAFARQIVIPTLPVSPFADTEVATNVVIHGSRTDVRDVQISVAMQTQTAYSTSRRSRRFTAGAAGATSSRTSAHGRGLKCPLQQPHSAESSTFSCITTSTLCQEALPRRAAVNRLLQLFPPRLHRHGFSGTNGTWCASSGAVRECRPSGCGVTSNTIPSPSR